MVELGGNQGPLRPKLDYFKAFDLATHDILVKKFVLYGINRTHIRWLKN